MSSRNPENKWGVLVVVIIGSFMAILDNNIVNVALPKIMASFGVTVEQIEWVITGYMIAFAISMPATSWLREVFGLKKVFIGSLVLFCIGSALCGMAWDNDVLVAFRIVQAIGGGALMPTGLNLVSESFPPQERGMAMGTWSIGAMVAPAAGPFIGGYIVDEMSWRFVFYVNLPVGLLAILASVAILSQGRGAGRARRFDLVGFMSFSLFLAFFLIALAKGQREGWKSDYIITCFSLSIIGLVSFVTSGLIIKEPIIDLKLFTIHNFLMANIINFMRAVAIFGSMFLLPLFLQNMLEYKAFQTGAILAPTAISVAITSPLSGIISDRIGPRIPLFLGTILMAYSLYIYKDISLNSDYWFMLWPQVLRGIGLGFINAPLMSTALNSVRREQTAIASGLITVIMQVGGAFGVALLGTTLERRGYFHYAHYLQKVDNPFSYQVDRALSLMQGILIKSGLSPQEVPERAKELLSLWIHKMAQVGAFQDAFVLASVITAVSIVPAIIVKNVKFTGGPKSKT